MGYVVFNGVSSASLGLVIQTPPEETYPSKDVETIHITGRNGDIILDKDSYKNGTRVYNFAIGFPDIPAIESKGLVYIRDSANDKLGKYAWTCGDPNLDLELYEKTILTTVLNPDVSSLTYLEDGSTEYSRVYSKNAGIGDFNFYTRIFTKWVHSAKGYATLKDSYAPDVYRMAAFYDGGSYVNAYDQATAFEVAFNCKPQKFIKSSVAIVVNPEDIQNTWFKVTNPTDQIAKPVFGPFNGVPITCHGGGILVSFMSSLSIPDTKYIRDSSKDILPLYFAWTNKYRTDKYKTVYTNVNTDVYICETPGSYDYVGNVETTYDPHYFKLHFGKNQGDDFDKDDHWTVDIVNDYGEIDSITINSEYMECYRETESGIELVNQYVAISGTEGFPLLFPGDNYIKCEASAQLAADVVISFNYWYL